MTPGELDALLGVLLARGVTHFEGLGLKVVITRTQALAEAPVGAVPQASQPSLSAEARLSALMNPVLVRDGSS